MDERRQERTWKIDISSAKDRGFQNRSEQAGGIKGRGQPGDKTFTFRQTETEGGADNGKNGGGEEQTSLVVAGLDKLWNASFAPSTRAWVQVVQ